jgi:pyridoxal phosphate enzyme (YggS family)
MPNLDQHIADNVDAVRERITSAARRAGRSPNDVKLIAVTKYASLEQVRAVVAAGCYDLGESRPQQLWNRAKLLADVPAIRWHMIGHLQRNKVEETLGVPAMIQSVDSIRLAEAIEKAASVAKRQVAVLLEVNVSRETAKHGFKVDEVEKALLHLAAMKYLDIRGLMCMAALEGGPDAARRDFTTLRDLRDRLQHNAPANVSLAELSMGMSGDYEVAIELGATMVRIGSALFEDQ